MLHKEWTSGKLAMSLTVQKTKLEELRGKLYVKAKTEPAFPRVRRGTGASDARRHVRPVRELDAGNLHVQFDEGGEETELWLGY